MVGQLAMTNVSRKVDESSKPWSSLGSPSTTIFTPILWYDTITRIYQVSPSCLLSLQDFIPIIDANSEEVLHIDFPPHYKSSSEGPALSVNSTAPPQLSTDSFLASERERIPPPRKAFDFLPDLMAKTEENFKPRDDVKPLHVVQPEGVSFKMNGHELEWQNWKMHIGM
jgi:hypothetical protein